MIFQKSDFYMSSVTYKAFKDTMTEIAFGLRAKCLCPTCHGVEKSSHYLDKASITARRNGGLCLSPTYVDICSDLLWQCEKKHEWGASYKNVVDHGTWCPFCTQWRSEQLVREKFEQIFQCTFTKCRPPWMLGLELDGFSNDLKLAFEFNGIQHYEFVPYFHRNKAELEVQQQNDRKKIDLCTSAGVQLYVVPHTRRDYFLEKGPAHLREFKVTQLPSAVKRARLI